MPELRLLSAGPTLTLARTNKEIASAPHISEGTVKNHLTSIFSPLGVQTGLRPALKARNWESLEVMAAHDLPLTFVQLHRVDCCAKSWRL